MMKKPQDHALRNGSSDKAERFKLAIAIVRESHVLSPEILALIAEITAKLGLKQ